VQFWIDTHRGVVLAGMALTAVLAMALSGGQRGRSRGIRFRRR
jgi:hypothetical protein